MDALPVETQAASLPDGVPADWSFGRDLPCPRCHYNLRARREPSCPECGLHFRWQTVLGVVCPRCGRPLHDQDGPVCSHCYLTLDWPTLFDSADPRRRVEFEYASGWLRPVLTTWVRALWPWTFWRGWRLDSPPMVDRLRALAVISLVVAVVGLTLPMVLRILDWSWIEVRDWGATAAIAMAPALVTCLLMPIFRGTFRRTGVRREQVGRFCAYVLAGPAWVGLAYTFAAITAAATNYTIAIAIGRQWLRPASALYFNLEHFFLVVTKGRLLWTWHPIEAWFNVGLGAFQVLIVFGWGWLFAWIGLRRGLSLPRRDAAHIFVATQICALALLMSILLALIPGSSLFEELVRVRR